MRSHHVTHAYKHVEHCTLSFLSFTQQQNVFHRIIAKIELKCGKFTILSQKYANSIKQKRRTQWRTYIRFAYNKCTCHLIFCQNNHAAIVFFEQKRKKDPLSTHESQRPYNTNANKFRTTKNEVDTYRIYAHPIQSIETFVQLIN